VRALVREQLDKEYVLVARAKGLSTAGVVRHHIGPIVAPALIVMLGLDIGATLGGALFVELTFGLPGLGFLAVSSIRNLDYPMTVGAITRRIDGRAREHGRGLGTGRTRSTSAAFRMSRRASAREGGMTAMETILRRHSHRRRRPTKWLVLGSLIALAAGCGSSTTTVAPSSSGPNAASVAPSSSEPSAPTVAPSSSAFAANDARRPAAKGGEAKVALAAGSIDHLEPTLWYFQTTWQIAYVTCTTLVRYPDASGQAGAKVEAGLAELPVVSADGTTYTFTLREGVKFKGGAPITALTSYTFERMLNPALASPAAGFFTNIDGASAYMAGTADAVSVSLLTAGP
jgi:hypothetical protein